MLYPIELLGRREMRASMVAIIHAFVMRDRESKPAYGAPSNGRMECHCKIPDPRTVTLAKRTDAILSAKAKSLIKKEKIHK